MSDQWYEACNGLSEHVLMDDFEHDHGVVLDKEIVVAMMRSHYNENLDAFLAEISLITDIARRFSRKLSMAVTSGGPREILTRSREAVGLTSLFYTITTFGDVLKPKPEPDLFLRAAQ